MVLMLEIQFGLLLRLYKKNKRKESAKNTSSKDKY